MLKNSEDEVLKKEISRKNSKEKKSPHQIVVIGAGLCSGFEITPAETMCRPKSYN